MNKPMSKNIRNLVERANKAMQGGTLRENDKLFYFISSILTEKNMYKGFNLYCWATLGDVDKYLKLAGSDPKHKDEKGRFIELPTDIRQFYLY